MAGWFPRLFVTRTVDVGTGVVSCPLKLRDVSVASCKPCPYLHATQTRDDGVIDGITCEPSYRALRKVSAAD